MLLKDAIVGLVVGVCIGAALVGLCTLALLLFGLI